jgi:glycosyltransferase involved in cell wall biosynthesis
MNTNISVLIPTLNEEKNLPFALESCQFAEKVFVLDSGSIDRTRSIAEGYKAEFTYHEWEGYARQKNWGLDNLPIRTDWVFILDADESITGPLRDELIAIATDVAQTEKVGFYINRHFIWQGRKILHCGYYPSWNLRFFRRGRARYEERAVHEHMLIDGRAGYLQGEMRHEDRRGREYLWQKHLKYAELEARAMLAADGESRSSRIRPSLFGNSLERRRAIKEYVWPYLPLRHVFRFIYMYVVKKGFLDGAAGLDMCLFMSRYEREIALQYKQLRKKAAA